MAYDESLAARVRAALPDAEEKKMMGGLCFMENGHMVAGIIGDRLLLRVGKEAYPAALAEPHVGPMDFTGKPLSGFVLVAPEGLAGRRLRGWLARARAFVATLPDKHARRADDDALGRLLAGRPARILDLVAAARKRIVDLVPGAREKVRPGWGLIGYDAPHYFAFLLPTDTEVRLGFEWGVMLSDPGRLLRGDGRRVRHVVLSPAILRSPRLAELVRAAAAIRPPRR